PTWCFTGKANPMDGDAAARHLKLSGRRMTRRVVSLSSRESGPPGPARSPLLENKEVTAHFWTVHREAAYAHRGLVGVPNQFIRKLGRILRHDVLDYAVVLEV